MKRLFPLLFLLMGHVAFAQNVAGKWYGKITQIPGGYSQLNDFELELSQKNRNVIWGQSVAIYKDSIDIRIGLSGYFDDDSLRLRETKEWVRKQVTPPTWYACIKNLNLSYRKEGGFEYLEGRWDGKSIEDDSPCLPGRVILSRTAQGLDDFLEKNKDSVITAPPIVEEAPAPVNFNAPFKNTTPNKVTEIVVHNTNLKLQLIDYLKVDNDTISIYLNRQPLAEKVRISKRAAVVNFKINPKIQMHELLLYADNLGLVPPNTSVLFLIDGDQTHRVMIESDKQKTAAIHLRYKPK